MTIADAMPASLFLIPSVAVENAGAKMEPGWTTEVPELPALGETVASTTRLSGETRLVALPGAVALISFDSSQFSGRQRFEASLAATDRPMLESLSAELLDLLPEAPRPEDRKVEFRFWAGGQEVTAITKRLAVEPWAEIEINYPASTRDNLDALMRDFAPGVGGKLVLWHGEPGTGKTYALRTLPGNGATGATFTT